MMNIDELKLSGIDYEDGLERFSGNCELYEKYLRKLLDNTLYEEMKCAAKEGRIADAFQAAHKLKAFIGNLSITHFYEEIKALTEDLRAGARRDYRQDFEELDQEYERIVQAIRGYNHV